MDRPRLGTRLSTNRNPNPPVISDPYGRTNPENVQYGYYQPPAQMYPNLPTQNYPTPAYSPQNMPQQQQPPQHQQPPRMASGDFYLGNQMANNVLNDQMANLAMSYGQNLMGQGKQMMDEKLEKYVPISKLKYYFAVDTTYVRRKLTLVLFPFTNNDWSIKYNQTNDNEPVAPRYELNAPDLYIPVMAFVTFLLMAGIALGVQNKFSPEMLGIQASSTFGWLVLEVIVLLITTYVMNISSDLNYLDIIAFCSYKYVGMIAAVCAGLLFQSLGFYVCLAYVSAALCYFLAKNLRIQVSRKSSVNDVSTPHGSKRRMYLILCVTVAQPLLMFWLTRHLIPSPSSLLSVSTPAAN